MNILFIGHTPLCLSSYGSIIRNLMIRIGKEHNVAALALHSNNKSELITKFDF
jgi:hypothetical protein